MIKLFLNSLVLTSFLVSLNSCSSENDEPGPEVSGKDLPKIQSFEWVDHFYGDKIIDGLNEFNYDSKGRVTKWSSDKQVSTYVYSDTHTASGKSVDSNTNTLLQNQSFTFNDKWMPLSQTTMDENGDRQEAWYAYDSKGRLENYSMTISDGRRKSVKLKYDPSTGLVSHLEFVKVNNADDDPTPVTYTFEYYDKENPVAFYPENNLFVDAEASFAIPGLDGYSRSKLIKSITFPLTPETGREMRYGFNYRFDSNNEKMTAVSITVMLPDADGKWNEGEPFADFLNIKY